MTTYDLRNFDTLQIIITRLFKYWTRFLEKCNGVVIMGPTHTSRTWFSRL